MSSPVPQRILMAAVGSAGDINPFIGIGRALRDRGHEVTLIAGEPFRAAVEHAGLRYVQHGTQEMFDQATSDPDVWHPRRGPKKIMGWVAQHMRDGYALIEEHYEPGMILLGHSISFHARVFEELHGVPACTVHLAPIVFRTNYQLPALHPGRDLSWTPTWFKRAAWWLADQWLINPAVKPPLNAWRKELGLPAVDRPFAQWIHSPRRVIALFPHWFAAPQPDWPQQVRLTGFPLYDQAGLHELSPELERFLAAGDPPIVFTPGSAMRHAGAFFRAAIDATAAIGQRALLLTKYDEQLPASLPDHVRHEAYVPFSEVFPRAAAVVHHGGIGTTSQCFSAGVPQLITPFSHDQPDNAARVCRLGAGDFLMPKRITPRRLAVKLAALVQRPSVKDAAEQCAARIDREGAIRQTCELIEELAPGLPAVEQAGAAVVPASPEGE